MDHVCSPEEIACAERSWNHSTQDCSKVSYQAPYLYSQAILSSANDITFNCFNSQMCFQQSSSTCIGRQGLISTASFQARHLNWENEACRRGGVHLLYSAKGKLSTMQMKIAKLQRGKRNIRHFARRGEKGEYSST